MLPGPNATLGGPTFEQWLTSEPASRLSLNHQSPSLS